MINRRNFLESSTCFALGMIATPLQAKASAGLRGDIKIMREILAALHPGLYRYSPPRAVDAALVALDRQWVAQPDQASRYLNLSRFLATIRCGHSYANFFNQKKPVQQALFDRPTRLPFAFRWIGEQMVVTVDQSGTGTLPRGTLVKSVNGVPAKNMLKRLLPFVRADGHNEPKRRALLSMTGKDEFETFDIFHGLVYGAPVSGLHRVEVRMPGASGNTMRDVPALSLAQRQSFIKAPDDRTGEPAWNWQMRGDGIAVLTMDGWALYNSKWDWQSWLNDRLDSLKGAKGLVVDIRENEGGLDCGDVILSRLAARDIVRPSYKRVVRYVKTQPELDRYLDTWDDSFRDWGSDAERFNDRYYQLKRDDGGIIAAKGPRVNVPMAVLTSAQNSSATFQFVNMVRQSGLGTLVGETTGGNQRGINGGAFFFARLPESGLEFDVPLIGYFPADPKPDAGIEPDIAVAMTASAIAEDTDPQLDAAVRHLSR